MIIPVYQVESYIEDCIRSVMRQTYQGTMECLIVDDCGTDDSISIAERMITDYKGTIRFVVLHHDYNRGLSAARNTVIVSAMGEYVFFLDSDDEILPDCISLLMEQAAADLAIELVQGNTKSFPSISPDFRTKDYTLFRARGNKEARTTLFGNEQFPAFSWNKLVKRSFILEHELWFKEGVLYEDNLWQFHLMKYLSDICFVPSITYLYRTRANSIMTGTDKQTKARNLGIVYHEILSNLTKGHEKEEYDYYAKGLAKVYFRYAHVYSGLKDDFRLCWRNKALCSMSTKVWLTVSYVLEITCFGRLLTSLFPGH